MMLRMCGSQNLLQNLTSRNSWVGAMKPELPTTGSKMTPAISPLFCSKSSRTLSRSLYFAHSVVAARHGSADNVSAGAAGQAAACGALLSCAQLHHSKL